MLNMPPSPLDWMKKLGADFASRIGLPVFVVDDTPPEFEDGGTYPAQLEKTTGGIKVYAVNATEPLTTLASTVGNAMPVANSPAVAVRILDANILTTQPAPTFAASTPSAGSDTGDGAKVWLQGYDRRVQVDLSENPIWTMPVTIWQGAALSIDQGNGGDPGKAWATTIVGPSTNSARITGHGEQRTAGRKRITAFAANNVENLDLYGFTTAGSATHQIHTATRSQEIAVTGTNGDAITWQSHTNYPLPPGTPYMAQGVVAFSDAGQNNQLREIALGDSTDYVGLRFDGTDVSVYVMSALTGTPVSVPRASWLDPLDGTGGSGATIDWTNFNTFEATGGGPGISGAHASINEIRIVELPAWFNIAAALKHTEHPVRATVTNTGTSASGHIRIKCFTIDALGDYLPQVVPSAAPIVPSSRPVGTGGLPVLSIRAKTNLPMVGGPAWRGHLLAKIVDISASGGKVAWSLIENPSSLTNASWVSAGDASGMEYDVSATAVTIGAGKVIANGTLATSIDSARIALDSVFKGFAHSLRVRTDGIPDVLTLFVAATVGSADVRSSFLVDVVG